MLFRMILCLCVVTGFSYGEDWDSFYKKLKVESRNRDKLKFAAYLQQMSSQDHEKGAAYLISLMRKRTTDRVVSLTARDVLGKFSSAEAQKLLTKEAGKNRENTLLLQSLVNMRPEGSYKYFYSLLKMTRSSEVQAVLLRAIAGKPEHPAEIYAMLLKFTGKRYRQEVRVGAVKALGSVKYTASVPTLVAMFDDILLRDYCIDALQRLTGQTIAYDASGWKKWYAENKEFTPVNSSTSKYMQELYEKPAKDDPYYSEFYDIPIEGKNILFIIDRSGSMAAPSSGGTRFDVLKKEFKEMMGTMSYERSIALNFFPGKPYRNGALNKLSPETKEALGKYIDKVGPGGSTPLKPAMEYSFDRLIPKNDIDTIYLLTDGKPNSPEEVVRRVIEDLNSTRYIKIHTISIGENSKFLKNVANDNNGKYTEIKD